MRVSAPTNTAARKLLGDTIHALYKLPRGTMLSRRARMSAEPLRRYRRLWARTITQAIDEISFISQDTLFQINQRSQEAKDKPNKLMGGLATLLCGDFLQLPPVEGTSLAQPLDAKGFTLPPEMPGTTAKDAESLKNEAPKDQECSAGL